MQLWCRKCDGFNEFPRNWLDDGDACKHCGAIGFWRTATEPMVEWDLNENDRRMLRSLRIAQE